MNGRIYDPLLGRMLSADIVVQDPFNLQGYNRYSYVDNNPLRFIDPTGFSLALPAAAAAPLIEAATSTTPPLLLSLVETSPAPAAISLATFDVAEGMQVEQSAPGWSSGGPMFGGWSAASYANSQWALNQADAASHAATTPTKPAEQPVANAKPQETSSGGNIDPEKDPKDTGGSKSTIKENSAAGKGWEKQVVNQELPKTQTDIREQITIKPNGSSAGNVRLDGVGKDSTTGQIKLTDAKASPTAPLTKNQGPGYQAIEQNGGTVVGQGKPPYTGGTVIPPTKVDIIVKKPDGTIEIK